MARDREPYVCAQKAAENIPGDTAARQKRSGLLDRPAKFTHLPVRIDFSILAPQYLQWPQKVWPSCLTFARSTMCAPCKQKIRFHFFIYEHYQTFSKMKIINKID